MKILRLSIMIFLCGRIFIALIHFSHLQDQSNSHQGHLQYHSWRDNLDILELIRLVKARPLQKIIWRKDFKYNQAKSKFKREKRYWRHRSFTTQGDRCGQVRGSGGKDIFYWVILNREFFGVLLSKIMGNLVSYFDRLSLSGG